MQVACGQSILKLPPQPYLTSRIYPSMPSKIFPTCSRCTSTLQRRSLHPETEGGKNEGGRQDHHCDLALVLRSAPPRSFRWYLSSVISYRYDTRRRAGTFGHVKKPV